jgi:hypothetical protein
MKTIYSVIIILIVLTSCTSNNEQSEENFYALTEGNKWVYKYYSKDSNTGMFSVFAHKIDSVEITGTETFNNKIYYVVRTKSTQTENNNIDLPNFTIGETKKTTHVRDSLGYLISNTGVKLYWNNNNEERFYHSILDPNRDVFAKLNNETTNLNVQAGNFQCLNFETFTKNLITNINSETVSSFYNSDGIGRICEKIGYTVGGAILFAGAEIEWKINLLDKRRVRRY